ncbi:MAG TPA: DUF72 domain-containing protein [Pyrinomonadaceae bacterium]|jgi:uncharacterized protein YecE (DUF72 family)|nr:DUF72 domain-containing protein [Pyrinomonadaceae bacterium]
MNLHVGTSGYSYKEWKGNFYPEDLPAKEMLAYYSRRLPAVEINNTFYRLPQPSMIENWKEQVPPEFRFSIKATQRITHIKRLNNCADETKYLLETAGLLEDRLGVVLFQLPPNAKKDVERLRNFLSLLPSDKRAAFEFRHESWFDDEALDILRNENCALVVSDIDEKPLDQIVSTASWGYLRLRRMNYEPNDLVEWMKRINDQKWSDAFVFFKHEDEGVGPKLAAKFLELRNKS